MIKTVNGTPVIPALKGALVSLVISFVALIVAGFFLVESKSLTALTAVLPKIIQAISAIIGGFFAARFSKERGYLSGIICGLIFSAIIIIGSLINSDFKLYYALISASVITVSSFIGSLLNRGGTKSGAAKRRSIMKKLRS